MPNQHESINPLKPGGGSDAFQSRKTKLVEFAQGVMAERFGQSVRPPESNSTEPVDKAQISRDAVEELESRGTRTSVGADNVISALKEITDTKLEKARENTERGGSGAKKKKTREVEWEPTTKKGSLHEGRGVIGNITIKEKSVQEPSAPGSAKGKNGAAPVQAQVSGGSKNSKNSNGGDGKDQAKLSPEGAEMAAKLKQSGAQLPESLKAGEGSATTQKSSGGAGGVVFNGEVRTRAQGLTQTAEVTPGGPLQKGQPLRRFQKLDDMPMLDHATIHGKDGEQIASELQEKSRRGELNGQELTAEKLQKLKEPVAQQ